MAKIGIIIFMIMAGIMTVIPSYGQEEPESWQIKTASGTISQTDFVGSLIVVNTSDDSLTITVTDSTRIMNGIEKETINELEIVDNVVVKYYDAGLAGLKAINIDDKNSGNAW